jgi:RNA repair pathway DNA polymerase beta family
MKLFDRYAVVGFSSGSINRNLNDEQSDVDEKYYVLPTFEDLYSGKTFKDFESTPEYDREVQDVRRLEQLWFKANPTYVELLFAKEIKTFGHHTMRQILEMKDDIAAMNLSNFFSASMGIYDQQMRDMKRHTSEKVTEMIEEFGYNPKKFAGGIHSLRTIIRFHETDFKDYAYANWYEGKERDFYIGVKRGELDIEEALDLANDMYMKAKNLERIYKSQPLDEKTNKYLKLMLRHLVQYRL